MIEYVIWGKQNPFDEEKLLLTKVQGEKITNYQEAVNLKNLLQFKYFCSDCRIQEINMGRPDNLSQLFSGTVKN